MIKNKLLSIAISKGSYQEFVQTITQKAANAESGYTCVANVHMLVEAYRDASFAQIVNNATLIAPDGKPIVWALYLLYGIKQDRVDGMGLLPSLLASAECSNVPVFIYGGSQTMLDKTNAHIQKAYPALNVAGMYSPPFRQLTADEEEEVVARINNSGAKLVFVVLGCPKQERWMASMKGLVQAFMVGIGGALPVLIGEQKRAPGWMQSGGLEWLYRLLQEPRRLFRRYAITNSIFLYLLCLACLRKRVLQRGV